MTIPACESSVVMPARKYPMLPLIKIDAPIPNALNIWYNRRNVRVRCPAFSERNSLCVLATTFSHTMGTLLLDTLALKVVNAKATTSTSKIGCDFSPPFSTVWRNGSAPCARVTAFQKLSSANVNVDNATVKVVSFQTIWPARLRLHSVAMPNKPLASMDKSKIVTATAQIYHGRQRRTLAGPRHCRTRLCTMRLHYTAV